MITLTEIITAFLISAYAPTLGGINCDGDCSVMAGGNAPYEGALACPAWIPLGTVVLLNDSPIGPVTAICEDRGGMIIGNKTDFCLTEGDVLARARAWGRRAVAATVTCWGCYLQPREVERISRGRWRGPIGHREE